MITTKLNDPGAEHDGVPVLLCVAVSDDDGTRNTCVRADNTTPAGVFGAEYSPLLDLDVHNGYDAWVFRTADPLGYIRSEHRLKLLLGEEVIVGKWRVRPI